MKLKILLIPCLLLVGCSSMPRARRVHLELAWIKSTLGRENYGFRHPERTAPLLDGSYVYQGNGVDGVVAMDQEHGTIAWRFDVRNGVESGFAVNDTSIYFGGSDGQFYSLNKFSGKINWSFPTRAENLAMPLLAQGIVYFLAGNNVLYALDAKTGKQVWLYNRGDVSSVSVRGGSRPTLYKNTLYVGFSDGYLTALNSSDGSLIWERKLNSNLKFIDVDATPIVEDDLIWVSSFDGALFCLSRSDGQVQWRLDEGGAVAVTIDGDNLYYSSLNQNIYALKKRTGAVIWRFSYEEKYGVATQPVLYKGLIVAATSDGEVMALSQLSGKLLSSYRPGAGVFATPSIDANTGRVYVFSNQANLHLLKIAWHRPEDDLEWPK